MSLAHKIFASLKGGGDGTSHTLIPNLNKSDLVSTTATPVASVTSSSSPQDSWGERFYHVAVQGCCHGELDRIYEACAEHERQTGKRIDLLLCCGDFQAVRAAGDLHSMAVPDKYKVLGDFHKYFADTTRPWTASATKVAPYLTIFVGGNHENSDLLAQESYGGFVAPNVYYLGHSGVITVDGSVTIAGLSGIFKEQDYDRPYPPRPYAANFNAKKTAYHVRRIEVEKLHAYLRASKLQHIPEAQPAVGGTSQSALPRRRPPVDIFLSHDWPVGITSYGDESQLLRFKPYFRDDIRRHALGNPHTMRLLREAQAPYWFAAHLHCFFEATVSHTLARQVTPVPTTSSPSSSPPATASTAFVALDKCAKGHGFLTFVDIPRPRGRPTGATTLSSTRVAPAALDKAATTNASSVAAGCAASTGTSSAIHNLGSEMMGATRIRRDPLWVEVLKASHRFLAANRVAGEREGHQQREPCGFDVEKTVTTILASPCATGEQQADVLSAPTTAAVLAALRLSPALPLQQEAPLFGPAAGGCGRGESEGQSSEIPPWSRVPSWSRDPRREGEALHRPHMRTRIEGLGESAVPTVEPTRPADCASPRSTAGAPLLNPVTMAKVGGLSFFEDVAPIRPAPLPSPPPPHPPTSASSLGWFEDVAPPP